MKSVYSAVRTGSLNTAVCAWALKVSNLTRRWIMNTPRLFSEESIYVYINIKEHVINVLYNRMFGTTELTLLSY